MGCRWSKNIYGNDPFTFSQLTTKQRVTIAVTWGHIVNFCPRCCLMIFVSYFKADPEAKNLFTYRDLDGDDLLRDPTFRGHTVTFQRGLNTILNTMTAGDSDQQAEDMVLELGMRHVQILGDNYTSMTASQLYVFEKTMGDVIREELGPEKWTVQTESSWRFILRLITGKMKQGLELGCKAEIARKKKMNVGDSSNGSLSTTSRSIKMKSRCLSVDCSDSRVKNNL